MEFEITPRMREAAGAIVRLLEREAVISEMTGRPFHFIDPDDDWGGFLVRTITNDLAELIRVESGLEFDRCRLAADELIKEVRNATRV